MSFYKGSWWLAIFRLRNFAAKRTRDPRLSPLNFSFVWCRAWRLCALSFVTFLSPLPTKAQSSVAERVAWNRPVEPFRIAGNVYYVGAEGVSSFLIVDKKEAVLLDGGFEETAPQIEKNLAKLGFSIKQVRYLINSHAHYDHCGGLARLKKDSGAIFAASEGDRSTLESGKQSSFGKRQSDATFPAVHVDRVLHQGDRIDLGSIHLTVVLTPGHTKGSTTWTMPLVDGSITRHVVFHSSETVAGNDLVNNKHYPQIVQAYEQSFETTAHLQCDIFLAPHPSFFRLEEKRQRMQEGHQDAFVNPDELQSFNEEMKKAFYKQLDEQKKRK